MVPISALREFTVLKAFSDEQLNKLAAIATEESHSAGAQLYQKGDPARSLFLVRKGRIVLFMETYMGPHRPSMQVTVDMVAKGEGMGWSAVMEPHIYTLGATCMEDSVLVAIEAESLRKLIEEDCATGLRVMQGVARMIASRLTHTRIILVGERGMSTLTEY
jgi:CRP-like cAMP-binding protein